MARICGRQGEGAVCPEFLVAWSVRGRGQRCAAPRPAGGERGPWLPTGREWFGQRRKAQGSSNHPEQGVTRRGLRAGARGFERGSSRRAGVSPLGDLRVLVKRLEAVTDMGGEEG